MSRGQLSKEDRLRVQATRLTNLNRGYRQTIAELKTTIKAQNHRIKELEAKLEDKEAQRKELLSYLYKQNKENKESKKMGKKPGAPAYHRPLPKDEEVTSVRSFPLQQCPLCEKTLGNPAETHIRYQEDIDLAPRKRITKFVIDRYWCSNCETFVRSTEIPIISRIGKNVMAYILYARYRLRLPQEKIKQSLDDLHDFKLSAGEISEKLSEAQALFGKDYQAISELVSTAKAVYADETGWRMNGENWWLWSFTTKQGTRYVIEETRGGGVPQLVLGTENKNRVIISDGYAVYQKLTGEHQQCWVHLLRNAKMFSPPLYHKLAPLYERLGQELTKPINQRDPPWFVKQLDDLIQKPSRDKGTWKIKGRIRRHRDQLLTCLRYEGILPENNTAERAIRPQVVMRKIFGGSRSLNGAQTHAVNTSVIETLKQRHPNVPFFETIVPLIGQRMEERAHSRV